MIISVNWLKKFTNIDLPIPELATLIGARLVEIENVIDFGAKYKGVVVARVIQVQAIEGSDHLNVTKLDDDGVVSDSERDENGYVQVVCGAPNVRTGMLVAWLPPGSTVPETFDHQEPFVLGSRMLQGVVSNGMIASPRELGLFDDHEGILEIDVEVKPGTPFAEAYELDDYLLDIENKSLTHRPDTFGVVGFAREAAAIAGKPFTTPEWLHNDAPNFGDKQVSDGQNPVVTIDNPTLSARYLGVVLSRIDGSAPSPLAMQTYLARAGVRPISAVVDTTNYLMLETGQPLHAFDYDKLSRINSGKIDIHVRGAREGERLVLLDGRTIELAASDIVIANGETAVALAGAMGGAATEIDEHTKTIFLESATFNLYNLRATQMRHGIFSEAVTRFTKGQPGELTAPVLARATMLLRGYVGAVRASDIIESYPDRPAPAQVTLPIDTLNDVLGTSFSVDQAVQTMKNVEFQVRTDGNQMIFTPPYWRADIHIPEDIIEEIGRLNGFDNITPTLPQRDFTAVQPSRFDQIRAEIRRSLVRAGANEVLTYSFVHGDVLIKAGQKTEGSYRIINSISPELQYYRQTLTPSLLSHIHSNIKQGYDSFALFEVNKVHPKLHGMTDEGVPSEADTIALTVANKKPALGAPYYMAKNMLEYLGTSLGLDFIYSPIKTDPNYPVTAPFEHRRAALVTDKKTDTFIGIVGEYKKSVSRAFKLPGYAAGFEIGSLRLLDAVQKLTSSYRPVSRFPSVERDICFQVASSVSYSQIVDSAMASLHEAELESSVEPVDIYQAEGADHKNITIRLKLTAYDRTLTGDEASELVGQVITRVLLETDAKVI